MHIEDLRKFAPLWLSKTEEVRNDREHWATNITGDIYGKGWISEMYGYSFGAAEVRSLDFILFLRWYRFLSGYCVMCLGKPSKHPYILKFRLNSDNLNIF
jgi:hypothetical protein